jgi:hypothetical protein
MFAAYCPTEGTRVLLSERHILGFDFDDEVVEIRFRCRCGTRSAVRDRRLRPADVLRAG